MGLLSDPARQKKILAKLARHYTLVAVLLWCTGMVWMVLLCQSEYNAGTYVSENALLPGAARAHFQRGIQKPLVEDWVDHVSKEYKAAGERLPVDWLMIQMEAMGLDAYNQSFDMKYSYGTKERPNHVNGSNVYGVLRAKASGGTEGLVIGVAYGLADGTKRNHASLGLALALMKYFTTQAHWSRDIVLLVTEGGHAGVEAWLEGYHGLAPKYGMQFSPVEARAGILQAAIFIDIPSQFTSLDIKFEGVNSQLSNLDLVNTIEGIGSNYIPTGVHHIARRDKTTWPLTKALKGYLNKEMMTYVGWVDQLWHMIRWQASGLPSGPHGLFYRYNIAAAVTIHGIPAVKGTRRTIYNAYVAGRLVEETFRSLSNLMERFHQSFFFYMLPSITRYVSIGLYMPPILCTVAGMTLTAVSLWLLTGDWIDLGKLSSSIGQQPIKAHGYIPSEGLGFTQRPRLIGPACTTVVASLIGGLMCTWLPMWALAFIPAEGPIKPIAVALITSLSLYYIISSVLISLVALPSTSQVQPSTVSTNDIDENSSAKQDMKLSNEKTQELEKEDMQAAPLWQLVKCGLCCYVTITLACLSLVNPALSLCLAGIYAVPCLLVTRCDRYSVATLIQLLAITAMSPPVLTYQLSTFIGLPVSSIIAVVLQSYESIAVYTYIITSMVSWPVTLMMLMIVFGTA